MVTDAPPAKSTAPPAGPGKTAKPRRKGWRVLRMLFRRAAQFVVLLLVALVALGIGWLRSPDFQVRAIRVTETVLERAIGEQVTLTRVRVRFWPPGIDVDGFHVFSGETGETILAAERIRVPLRLTVLGPRIGRLELRSPTVHVHLDEKGQLLEFRNRVRPGRGARLREIPFSNLALTGGTLQLTHPEGTVLIEDFTAIPNAGRTTDLTGVLTIQARGLVDRTAFRWANTRLGPQAIEVPEFALDLATIDARGHAFIPLEGAMDIDLDLQVALEEINPLLTPPRKAHGTVNLTVAIDGEPDDPTIVIDAAGRALGLDMPGVFTPLLTYDLQDITGHVVATRAGIRIDPLVLHWADGQIVATGDITPDRRLENGEVAINNVSLAPLMQYFDAAPTPWIDMRSQGLITWAGPLQPLRLEGTFGLGVVDLQVADRPIADPRAELLLDIDAASALGTIVLEKDRIVLESQAVRGPRSTGSLAVDIGFGPRGPLDLWFDLDGADLEDFQPLNNVKLKGKGRVTARIAGPFNKLTLTGDGDIRDFSVLGIHYADHLVSKLRSPNLKSIELEGAKATLGHSSYHGRYSIDFRTPVSMSTAIEIDAGRVEDLVHMFVDLDGLKGDLTGLFTLDGPLLDMSGEQHVKLANVDIYGEKFPVGEGHGFMDGGLFTLDDLRVRRDKGRAGITLRGTVQRDWSLDMEVVADGLDLRTLDRLAEYELPLSGKVAAAARITNTLYDPSPDGRIWLTGLQYAGAKAGNSLVHFDTTDGVAAFNGKLLGGSATIDGTLGLWREQAYAFNATLNQVPAHLFYPLAADGTPIRAVASGSMQGSGHFGQTWSPVSLSADITAVETTYGEHVLRNATPWHYEQDGNKFRLAGFNIAGGKTSFKLNASGGSALLVGGDGVVDLDLLRAFVPGLEKATGTAAVNLYAVGSRPNVEAVVDIEVNSQLFRHSSMPMSLEDARAKIDVREDKIVLKRLTGNVGGGTFTGSGTIECKDWKPVRYNLAMDVGRGAGIGGEPPQDAMVQWVTSLPPAIGNGHFEFDGPTDALLLSGDVSVSEMTFADRIDWEDWVIEYRDWMLVDPATIAETPPMFNLNVQIAAERTIWLQNNLAEGVASADLRIIGDTVRPGLVGNVTIEEGLAFLQDREFRIDRGNLMFNNPWTWDPQLDISLLTDITTRDQRYRVDYLVLGPFSNWRSESRSDPPLPQADVNALLWFGVTTDQLEAMGELQSAVVQGVADLLVTDFLVSGQAGEFGDDISELLFDRIDLATGVNARGEYSPDPRLVVEKRLTDIGDVDLKWEFNLVRPEDNYVTAIKRIGGIWSLAGWYATLQRERNLPIGGAYGVDVVARWEIE